MRALSLKQPWASYVAIGLKTIETRTWSTKYRGKLLIVSSKTFDQNFPAERVTQGIKTLGLDLPMGQALAIVDLIRCRPMRPEDEKLAMTYRPDLYAWVLANIQTLVPFPVRGRLGLYEVNIIDCALCHKKIDPATLKGGRIKVHAKAEGGKYNTIIPKTWDWCTACRERALKSKEPRGIEKESQNEKK